MSEPSPNQPWRPRYNPWVIALTVTLATFMETLDTSIANVALPHIAGSLSATQDESTWVLTSYLVANAVVLPLSAWIADRMGRKRFYMTCVFVFTVSSLLCGLAPSLPLLIFFRVLQGIGGGGLATSEQAILSDTFEPSKRGMGFAIYGMAVVFAPAIGPTLGGWITDNYSWHWIFFINVPIGVLSLLLTQQLVEDPPHVQQAREKSRTIPMDFVGAGLIALGLGALEVTLDKGQEEDWFASPFITFFAVVSAVALLYFIVWEWRERHPVLNLRLLRNSNLAISCALMLLLGAALYGSTTLIPQYLQNLMNYTAESAGEALSLGGITVIFCMPLVGVLVSKMDARILMAIGFLETSLAMVETAGIYPGISFGTAAMYRVYQSIGIAFMFVPISTISFIGVAPEDNNQVSGLTNLMRNLGGTLGISALTTLLARREQVHQTFLAAHTAPTNPLFRGAVSNSAAFFAQAGAGPAEAMRQAYGSLYQTVRTQASALAYIDIIWVFAFVAVLGVPLAFLVRNPDPGAGAAMH